MLSDFLRGARAALVVEDGAIAFDLANAKYSISGEYNKCLLHLWSSERNFVRRVLDIEVKATTLRLQVQRMGQNRPTRLDFCRDRDQRSPADRRASRAAYAPRLRRVVERNLAGWTVVRLTGSIDLEHSFGPAYLRGWLRQGQRSLAIVGAEYILRWLAPGTHHWEQFVTPAELDDALKAAGLAKIRPQGVVYNPLTKGWSLSKDCDVNYFMSAARR